MNFVGAFCLLLEKTKRLFFFKFNTYVDEEAVSLYFDNSRLFGGLEKETSCPPILIPVAPIIWSGGMVKESEKTSEVEPVGAVEKVPQNIEKKSRLHRMKK